MVNFQHLDPIDGRLNLHCFFEFNVTPGIFNHPIVVPFSQRKLVICSPRHGDFFEALFSLLLLLFLAYLLNSTFLDSIFTVKLHHMLIFMNERFWVVWSRFIIVTIFYLLRTAQKLRICSQEKVLAEELLIGKDSFRLLFLLSSGCTYL